MNKNTCPVCNGPISPTDAVCPTCGFKLMGTTQEFNPVNMGSDSFGRENEIEPVIEHPVEPQSTHLTVVRGPQTGVAFELGSEPITIGRSPKCDIFLNDMTVSREHARIQPTEHGFKIIDNNSFNGIWINNENVSEALLKDDDIIQIGAFCLAVSC